MQWLQRIQGVTSSAFPQRNLLGSWASAMMERPKGDQICFPLGKDLLRQVGIVQATDNGHGRFYCLLDGGGKFHIDAKGMESAGDHVLIGLRIVEGTRSHMNQVHLSIQQFCEFHLIFNGQPAFYQLAAAQPEFDQQIGTTLADSINYHERYPGPVFQASAVLICTMVVQRR